MNLLKHLNSLKDAENNDKSYRQANLIKFIPIKKQIQTKNVPFQNIFYIIFRLLTTNLDMAVIFNLITRQKVI